MAAIRIIPLLLLLGLPSLAFTQSPHATFSTFRKMELESPFGMLEWKSIGPTFQGGRIESLDSPPGEPAVIYAGFGSGSLWKSTNQGLSWENIFRNEASSSVGDVCIAPSNPDVIYLGTGEALRASRGYTYPGSGIYKSSDAGKSWQWCGLGDSYHIGRIVVDPNNAELVFAAVIGSMWSPGKERGLYLSQNGGKDWKCLLHPSDSIGVVDVAWDPVNRILYAASWEMVMGKGSGIYRSTDLGTTWQRCINGFPTHGEVGRIGLSISPSHPKTVYAVIDNRAKAMIQGEETLIGAEVYRSEDSGLTWTRTHSSPLDIYSGFGWAFGDIRVSPFDRKKIYVLGIHTLVSQDGGKSFARLAGSITHLVPNPGNELHLDNHDLLIDPTDPERLLLGNDGGIYLSHDEGKSWLHMNNLPVGEFYDLYVEDRQDRSWAFGGTQDNSNIFGPIDLTRSGNGNHGWNYVWLDPWSGGDGFTSLPDPQDRAIVYYASQNGYLNRKNFETGETKFIQPSTDPGETPMRTSWFTPWLISRHTPGTLYYGSNKVYKTINRGDKWYRLSHDLCYSEDPLRKSRATTALAESPLAAGLLYAGTEKGALWVSRDDGINWIEISNSLPYKAVMSIVPSRHLEGRVFLVMRGLDEDDYNAYLFLSENRGVTWVPISGGLPHDRINCLIEDPSLPQLVFIGTDRGVFLSPDLGKKWISLSLSLPTTSVQKLAWANDHAFLVAATHGQSLFSLFTEPVRRYFKFTNPEEAGLLAVKPGNLPLRLDYQGDYDFEKASPTEVYWYQPKSGSMVLILTNSADKEIFGTRFEAKAGINHWSWNHIMELKEDMSLYPIPQIKFPAPGEYLLTIQGQGIIIKADLRIR